MGIAGDAGFLPATPGRELVRIAKTATATQEIFLLIIFALLRIQLALAQLKSALFQPGIPPSYHRIDLAKNLVRQWIGSNLNLVKFWSRRRSTFIMKYRARARRGPQSFA